MDAPAQRIRACSGASTPRGSPRAWRGGRCRPAAGRVRREGDVLFSDDVPSPCIGTEELCACVAYLECHLHLQLCGHLGLRWRQGRWLDSVRDRRLEASKNLMGRGSSQNQMCVQSRRLGAAWHARHKRTYFEVLLQIRCENEGHDVDPRLTVLDGGQAGEDVHAALTHGVERDEAVHVLQKGDHRGKEGA